MTNLEPPSEKCARDFIHLCQRLHTRQGLLMHDVVSILQKCLNNPLYQERALSNLGALASTNKNLKTVLENIQQEDDKLANIKLLAKQAHSQIENSATSKL